MSIFCRGCYFFLFSKGKSAWKYNLAVLITCFYWYIAKCSNESLNCVAKLILAFETRLQYLLNNQDGSLKCQFSHLHRVSRALSFFPVVGIGELGLPPTPHPAGEWALPPPPPLVPGREAHSLAREGGGGEPQFRRGDIHCGTLYIYVLCGHLWLKLIKYFYRSSYPCTAHPLRKDLFAMSTVHHLHF